MTPTHTVGPLRAGLLTLWLSTRWLPTTLATICHWPSAPLTSTRLVIYALGIHNLGHNMPLAVCALGIHALGYRRAGHPQPWPQYAIGPYLLTVADGHGFMYTPSAAVGIPRRAEDGLTPTHTVGPRALGYLRLGHLCHWPSAPLASTRLVIDALGIHNHGHNMPLAICALDTHNSGSHAIGHLCAWYPRRLPYAPLPPPLLPLFAGSSDRSGFMYARDAAGGNGE